MAFANVDATWINAVAGSPSYDDTELRRADAAMFAGAGDTADPLKVRGGIVQHASNSLAVTVDGSDVVSVQAGAVVIPGDNTAGNGVYRTATSAVQTDTLTARNATNARIDLVVFEIIAGGTQARVRIIAGDPSGSPVVPAKPSRSVELARISVPPVGGGAATVDSSKRVFVSAPGARLVVATESALPTSANLWEQAVAADTGTAYTWTGASWDPGRWQAFTPAWTATSTNPALGNGTLAAAYWVNGKTVHFRIRIIMGSTTTFGAGTYIFQLPVTPRGGFNDPLIVTAMLYDASVPARRMRSGYMASPTTIVLNDQDGVNVGAAVPFTFAAGDVISIQGVYEAA